MPAKLKRYKAPRQARKLCLSLRPFFRGAEHVGK